MVGNATGRLAENLSAALLDQDDPATVRDGGPAYLLMLDGLISGAPADGSLLLSGARLYTAYAAAFVDDPTRRRRLTARALDYARRAVCLGSQALCRGLDGAGYEAYARALEAAGPDQAEALYALGSAWAAWIEARPGDWRALAQLPRVEAAMVRVLALDEAYAEGGPHLYLGVLYSQRPASLGGRPAEGRLHFERALALSGGRNLMVKVQYARHYARLVFDRALHDRLLREVLEAEPRAPGLTLVNTLAQDQARALLQGAADYF